MVLWSRSSADSSEASTFAKILARAIAVGELGSDEQFALDIIHKELNTTMDFCDHTQIGTVDRSILRPGVCPTA